MNRITIAIATLALSAGIAHAQNAAPAPTPPRPAATAPSTAPITASVPSLGVVKGSAATAAEARTAYASQITARQTACTARGTTFRWSPAHSVGDANPKGGFYAKNSAGQCREMTLKQARELGLVTVR
jgi:hypothetical protein